VSLIINLKISNITIITISFVWNQYKEGHVQKCWRQIQAEAQSAKTGYEQCKAHFTDVYNITPDDLAADISILEISETTSREASENDDAAVGYVNDEYWKILACVTKCKVLNPLCQVAHLWSPNGWTWLWAAQG